MDKGISISPTPPLSHIFLTAVWQTDAQHNNTPATHFIMNGEVEVST